MDVYELEQALRKHSSAETPRSPLIPPDKNNGTTLTRQSRAREVSSRYRSPTPMAASSGPKRSPSPNITRPRTTSTAPSVPKRAVSAERRRPSTPTSPKSPATPVRDTSIDVQLACKKMIGNRLPEVLWPSTMRSLSVSFQSDAISIPISKKEKPATPALSDRTLRPSSNLAHKQVETPLVSRKPTPDGNRSLLKGKNSSDRSENSKPVDGIHARVMNQRRGPSRTVGKPHLNTLAKSTDLIDKVTKPSSLPHHGMGMPSPRRLSLDGASRPLQKSSDAMRLISSDESGKIKFEQYSVDDTELRLPNLSSSRLLEQTTFLSPAVRSQSLSSPRSCRQSPNKQLSSPSSLPRGVGPSRGKTLNPIPSRWPSPSRARPSSPSRESNSSTSVLSFIADIKKGKVANHMEDAHKLRLLYNRLLQWRYANAQADAALHSHQVTAEKTFYNVWRSTLELWDSVIQKRIDRQQLRLKLKFYSVLNEQMSYLNEWALIEWDHTTSLSRAIEDLQANTLRLPFTEGARADIETVKVAVCSAVDVMQAMGSSLTATLSKVEDMNFLVSELADLATKERAMLDECETLFALTSAMQVEENSLRTHFLQLK